MNLQDMMVQHDSSSRAIDKYLMPYEGRVIAVRHHPAVLIPSLGVAVGGLIICGVLATATGVLWIWWLWLIALGYLLWKLVAWSLEFFLVTEHRVMLITGVLNRHVAMMPLSKVTDITLDRSAMGQVLGYGTFLTETAGGSDAIRTITFMPYPEQLYVEVSSMIFGSVDESPD